jgi:hypothetical protein
MSNEELNTGPMTEFFEALFEKALDRVLEKRNAIFPAVDGETARKIAEIRAKPYITIPEAEFVYRCSDTDLYRCIHRAEDGEVSDPIPFYFRGSYVIPQAEFLEWLKRQRKEDVEKYCQESKGKNTLRHASLAARKGARQ